MLFLSLLYLLIHAFQQFHFPLHSHQNLLIQFYLNQTFFFCDLPNESTYVIHLSTVDLLKNVHLFYLNRLLRMFPILAAAILLIASWYNHVADGPYWSVFASKVDRCRTYWWSTLLYVQNYTNQSKMVSMWNLEIKSKHKTSLIWQSYLFSVFNVDSWWNRNE